MAGHAACLWAAFLLVLFVGCDARVKLKDRLHKLDKDLLTHSEQDLWFESMDERELAEDWSQDDGGTLAEKVDKLADFTATVSVDVQLVGFNGDGNRRIRINKAELMKYIKASGLSLPAYVLHPDGHQHRELPFRYKYNVRLYKPPRDFTRRLSNVIQGVANQNKGQQHMVVPVHLIDNVIAQHFRKRALSYTIYILNLPHPNFVDKDGTVHKRNPVLYSYLPPSATPRFHTENPPPLCTTSSWVGKERYAWIDLTAGPVTYGPQTSGEGIMTEFTLPRLERLMPRPPAPAAKAGTNETGNPESTPPPPKPKFAPARKHEFMAELSGALLKTFEHLITPVAHAFPVPYRKFLGINVIVITDDTTSDKKEGSTLPGWADLAAELKSLALAGQTIDVLSHKINFFDCELCVAAYTHSLKSHTSNVISDGLRTQVHQYLDSSDMKDWLEHFDQHFWGLREATVKEKGLKPHQIRVVTAFVYDLKTPDIILLDRFHQAVAFRDMVIAVQTRAPAAVVDFSCNGRGMQFDPRDASRAVLASVLHSAWGVAATHVKYNPLSNVTETDYLWSIGHTPFGYFSQLQSLSFAIRDAAARNVLMSEVNETITELAMLFDLFSAYEKEIDEVLSPAEHLLFVRRWNVLSFKLSKVRHFSSLNNFNHSLYYMRSAQHDLRALHMLIRTASQNLQPVMLCEEKAPPGSLFSPTVQFGLLTVGVAVFALLLTQTYSDSYLMRTLMRSKRLED